MKTRRILFFLMLSVVSIQCNNTNKSVGMTAGQLAANICECAESIKNYNKDLKQLAEQSDNEALMKRIGEGDQIMSQSIACVTDQIENDISHLITPELNKSISKRCQLDSRMAKDILNKVATYKIPH